MREIALDTETTGLNPTNGDRIVEFGCIELVDKITTGITYHQYVNPERSMPDEARKIHGLTDDFLADQPVMSEVIGAFLDFIGDAPLIIHNAEFDLGFVNAELKRLGKPSLKVDRVLDTVHLAREKFPGAPASLDALCKRFNVDNSSRTLHGALLDAQLLAEVYLKLIGGNQPNLKLSHREQVNEKKKRPAVHRDPRPHAATDEERLAHRDLLQDIEQPIWNS
mgnify:CR=1 FL=1